MQATSRQHHRHDLPRNDRLLLGGDREPMVVLWGLIPAEARGLPGPGSQPGLEAPSPASERHHRAKDSFTHPTRDTADILPRRMEFRSLVVLAGGFPALIGTGTASARFPFVYTPA